MNGFREASADFQGSAGTYIFLPFAVVRYIGEGCFYLGEQTLDDKRMFYPHDALFFLSTGKHNQ